MGMNEYLIGFRTSALVPVATLVVTANNWGDALDNALKIFPGASFAEVLAQNGKPFGPETFFI